MKQKILIITGIFLAIPAAIFLFMMAASQKDRSAGTVFNSDEVRGETFTFFDIGTNTLLTEALREALSGKLGDETIVKRSPIDLSMNYRGFLQQYAGQLYDLNIALNDPSGARIEHNATILTYRYPPKDRTAFDFISLMFSNYSHKPLVFVIRAGKESLTILNVLTSKYGEPKIHQWEKHQGKSYHWQKGKDVLILSSTVNRIGHPEFSIHIYFVNNIEELIVTEKKEALKLEQERKQIDREAF